MNILILTSTFPANKDDIMQHPFQMDFIDLLRKGNHQCDNIDTCQSRDP